MVDGPAERTARSSLVLLLDIATRWCNRRRHSTLNRASIEALAATIRWVRQFAGMISESGAHRIVLRQFVQGYSHRETA